MHCLPQWSGLISLFFFCGTALLAPAAPEVTGATVTEGDAAGAPAVFSYSLPALTAAETYEWALIPHRLRSGTDFTPYQSTMTFPVGPAATGTIPVPVLPDLLPEEHGELRLIARPSSAASWAASMSAPETPQQLSQSEVIYWQDDLIVTRKLINSIAYLETYERADDGTITLRSTMQGTEDLFFHSSISISRYAMVLSIYGALQTWLRNPASPFTWIRKSSLTGTNVGAGTLAGDRLFLSINDQLYIYRLDPERATGWRLTGNLGYRPLIFSEDVLVSPKGATTLQVHERSVKTEDVWKPVYEIPNIPALNVYLSILAKGMIAVLGEAGLEIHERLPNGAGWTRSAVLPMVTRRPSFDISFALAGDWLAVGHSLTFPGDDPDGTVQLFLRDAVDRSVWNPAGTLAGPGVGYGKKVLWNRGELVSLAYPPYSSPPVVVRKFHGGTGLVKDDDRSKLAICVSSNPEPVSGSSEAECYAELPLPAEADMLVTHEFITNTAVVGSDFTGVNGSVLINKGRSRAYVPFSVLADGEVEPDGSLMIRMETAGQAAVTVSSRIRSSNMAPVVIGTATPLLEGLGESVVSVKQVPATNTTLPTEPVSVGVRVQGMDSPPAALPLAARGTDLPGVVATPVLSAAVPTASLAVTASQDELVEPGEEKVSAIFSLPAGQLNPGTLGLSQEGVLPPLPANITGPAGVPNVSAGGGWMVSVNGQAIVDGVPGGAALCYQVSEASTPRVTLAQILPLNLTSYSCQLDCDGQTLAISGARLEHAVLMVYERTGPPSAPWELSFEWFSNWLGNVAPQRRVKIIHGDYLSWGMFLYERCTGHWPWRLINLAEINQPAGAELLDMDGEWLVASTSSGLRPYRRVRGLLSGWAPKNTFTFSPDLIGISEVILRDRTLFIHEVRAGVNGYLLNIYRENANGLWAAEQSLPFSATSARVDFCTDSMVAGGGNLYTRTGPAAAPWVLSGQLPLEATVPASSNYHLQLLQMLEANTNTPRFRLYQAGLPLAIADDDSLIYSLVERSGFGFFAYEAYGSERVTSLFLSANRIPPLQEQIRVRSRDTGSAVAGLDYAPVDFRLVCSPRASVPFVGAEFPIRIFSDRLVEGQEAFDLVIDPPVFGKVITPQTFNLYDPQNTGRQLPAGAATLYEPTSGSMLQSVEYILQAAPDRDVTLTPSLVTGGTAASGTDFALPVTPLVLRAGANRVRVPILIHADALDETNETVFLKMTSVEMPQNFGNVVLTIVDANVPGLGVDEGYTTTQGTPLTANGAGGAPPGVQANDSGVSGGIYQVHTPPAWGTVTMQPNGDFTAAPGPNAIGDLMFSYQVEMIPYRQYLDSLASWKYLHPTNGVSPAVANPAFPATWATAGFNDTAWPAGVGTLSYGGLATPVLPNAVNLAVPPSGARYTSYFRTTFSSPIATTLPLRLKLYCDDAVIVYINGVERGRLLVNTAAAFATAADTFTLLSGNPGQTDADEALVRIVDLPNVPLLAGTNLLAVSLHNASASSSDLGLRLESLEVGIITDPVPVRLTVTEVPQPPTATPDVFTCPQNSTFLSSDNYGPGVLDNDGLYGPSGSFYDPVTELVFSDVSTGTLTKIGTDGHFKYTPPPDFAGSAGFTYQIRDKDGLSPAVMVTLNVQPSLPYDLWRQQFLPGGGSTGDADGDGLNNFLEYALGSPPSNPALPAGYGPGILPPSGSGVPPFSVQLRKAADLAWWIESTSSPNAAVWNPLVEFRGLNYRFTHSHATSTLRNDTAESFTIDVSPTTTPLLTPRLFYRLRTERIAPQ
jgi:Bacterial Ig domain/Calx-beta domain